jgi:DNA polymerase-3 subunit delta'
MRMAVPRPTELQRADEIAGWPAPEERMDWFGDTHPEHTLLEAYRNGGFHHAWLIGGPKGIGKATLAYRLARFILAHPDPTSAAVTSAADLALAEDHPVTRKVAARGHPNLLILERPYDPKAKRFRAELTVAEVRRTVPFFGNTGGEDGWRITIVDAADDMNISAANALLKILEEPPSRSLFLIVSHAPGRLLPTIRSRCRRLDLRPLGTGDIARALAQHNGEGDQGALVAALAEGSLRRAVFLTDGGGLAIYQAFSSLVAGFPRLDVTALHAFADTVAARGRDDEWASFIDLVSGWLNRRVRGEGEPPGRAAALPAAVAAAPLESWAEVWENLRRWTADTAIYNLDRKRTALTIMQTLARATRM